jgi:cell division septal protein FtsQ
MTRDDARCRVEDHAAELMERLGTSVTSVVRAWSGDAMSFAFAVRGVRVQGTVHVDETDAILDLEGRSSSDRTVLKLFESRMRSEMEEGLKGIFAD